MALSVLGPVLVEGPDGAVPVVGRKTREVLALLALAAPRPVTAGGLADRLWDAPPPSATKTVQAHVSRVRSALAAAGGAAGVVAGGPGGYRVVAGTAQLDVLAVDDLRRRARVATLAGREHDAAHWLGQARRRWRGEPELPATVLGGAERLRLVEDRQVLVEDHLAAEIAAGRPSGVLGELESLTAVAPLRERLWVLRVSALHRCGRQADALQCVRDARAVLREQAGLDPGPELRALADAVLRQSAPSTGPPRAAAAPAYDGPHYTAVDGGHVAYALFGAGAPDVLLLNPTFVSVDSYLEEPRLAAALGRLAAGGRVIAFDRTGLGLSDPATPADPPSLARWTRDAVAVLDACGVERLHVLGNADTGLLALRLAAQHPDRVRSVTLVNGYARITRAPGYPHGEPPSVGELLREIRTPGSRPAVDVLTWIAPSVAGDARFRVWWDAAGRRSASPATAGLVHAAIAEADVRDLLPDVAAPVLVLNRLDCPSHDPGHGHHLVEHLPRAVLEEHVDTDGPWFLGDAGWVVDRFRAFVGTV